MNVQPSQFGMLRQMLDYTELRHRVIGQNLANVNTPNYHRLDVDFDAVLKEVMRAPDGKSSVSPARIYEVQGLPIRADGNNVDIDTEMGQLNKNALLYQTYSQVLASKLGMMRSAITGR